MDNSKQLLKQAQSAMLNAYAPYSKYHVGAAIYTKTGHFYAAGNVENISFPCGTCAEAGAIAAMISAGDKEIMAILIISDGKELVYPCGACLQRIAEFSNEKTTIYLAKADKILKKYKLQELLPYNFQNKDL